MFFLDTFLKGLKPRFDDDLVDRLNYYYTPMIIIVFSLTLSAKQYVGQPIQCWVPAQFTGAWEQYTENYCFVQNTYFQNLHDDIPGDYGERESREIGYYQWVPFILALEAVLFYLPCLIWRLLNWQSGITVKGIVTMTLDVKNMKAEDRKENVGVVASHIHDCLSIQRDLKPKGRFLGNLFYGKHYGSYVTGLYLVVKLLYIVNVISQFFILNSFIGAKYTFWGFEILRDVSNGRQWEESGHFPRVTMCDFQVRVMGNLHRWTVQCVLMINMFNEKIFIFLWWWFFIVAVVTICNFIYWVFISLIRNKERNFIHRYLRVKDLLHDSPGERKALDRFVRRHLRPDGVFLIRMIATNAGDLVSTEVVAQLWKQFLIEERNRQSTIPYNDSPTDDPGFVEGDDKLPLKSSMESSPRSHV